MSVQLLLECTNVISDMSEVSSKIETLKLSKGLCYTLRTERYKRLNLLLKRHKKSGRKGRRGTHSRIHFKDILKL